MITLYNSTSFEQVEVKPINDGTLTLEESSRDLAKYLYKCCPAENIRPIVKRMADALTVSGNYVSRGALEAALWTAIREGSDAS